MEDLFFVDPTELRLPPSRSQGADPGKLARQISRFGRDINSMPPVELNRDRNGQLKIVDGVTRATRAAKLLPGISIPAIIIADVLSADYSSLPTIGERLP